MLRTFSYYLNTEQVKKRFSDISEAKGLMKNALQDYDTIKSKFKITEETSSILVKNVYDCIRSALQSFLSLDGYTPYSHEAIISYCFGHEILSREEANKLDKFRILRNDISYRATRADVKEAEEIFILAKHILPRLENILTKKL
ncbi:MAG: hypothetical protein V1870_01940 [Candidatus Aenigmatarchaeota archaeon]